MKKHLLWNSFLLIGVLLTCLSTQAQVFSYSENFTQGTSYCPGDPQYDNWGTFRASLTSNNVYLECKIYGSLDPVGATCSDQAIVAQIAAALNSGTQQSFTCGGIIWTVGNACITGCAVTGQDIELNAANTGSDCSCGGNLTVRPCIGNANWGSIGTGGCNAATQTMTVEFIALSPFADDAGVNSIVSPSFPACVYDSVLKVSIRNWGSDTLDSVGISWSVNGVNQGTTAWTGTLGQFDIADSVCLDTLTFNVGDEIKVWTFDPNGVTDSAAINDTATVLLPMNSISGTYTIDGASPTGGTNFQTFADAILTMDSLGICGPIVFNVADGTYNEQVDIPEIPGASSINTVTFQSANGNPTLATITFAASSSVTNYTLNMNGADWITFKDLTIENTGTTFSRVMNVTGGADHNTFEGNIFQGDNSTTTTSTNKTVIWSNTGLDNFNTFLNNEIRGGSYGMYWYGQNTSTLEEGTVIDGNLFTRQYFYGIRAWYHDDMKFRNNVFSSLSTYTGTSYGFYFYYCDNEFEVTGNRIEALNQVPRHGLYFVNCDGTATQQGVIANNTVHVGTPTSSSSHYGIYVSNTGYQNIYNNSVALEGTGTFSRSLYIVSGGANKVYNNIFAHFGSGYAAYLNNSFAVTEMDNNNLYTNGNNLGFFSGNQASLADWQSASGFDLDGQSVDPLFYNYQTNDLHVCNDTLDGTGKVNTLITEDFEGQARNAGAPDIGADEFTSLGNYSIGNDPTVLCQGDSIQLSGALGAQNIWTTTTIDTADFIWVNTTGQVSVSVTNNCGTVDDTVMVMTNIPVDLPTDTNLCFGTSGSLMADITNGTYNWTGGLTTQSITVSTAGLYVVDVVDSNGCQSSDSTVVTVSQAVDLPSDTTFCQGSNITLDAGLSGSTYAWTPGGEINQTITVNSTGTYGVTVTDQFNCVSTDQVTLTEILLPTANFTSTSSFTAVNFSNSSANGLNYTWDFGDGQTSNLENPIHIYATSGGYFVTLTVSNECDTVTYSDSVFTTITSVEDLEGGLTYNLFPNPNGGEFSLSLSASQSTSALIEVTDVSGRVVYAQNLGSISGELLHDIDLGEVSTGVYFVKLSFNDRQVVEKLSVN